jgi:glucose-6-phosphate isomerase
MQLTNNPKFGIVKALAGEHCKLHLADLMLQSDRVRSMAFDIDGLSVDCTRQILRDDSFKALVELAEAADLERQRDRLFAGETVNNSEVRPVTHHSLRYPERLAGNEWSALASFSNMVRSSGRFQHIVNIGVGGSHLGAEMVIQSLRPFHDGPPVDFVSNLDPAHIHDVLDGCNPKKTCFIITSKTFGTLETLTNAGLARDWLEDGGVEWQAAMVAVTASPGNAKHWGIPYDQIFELGDGVGGRFSVWSAVGLPVMCAIGVDRFAEFLLGGFKLDQHYRTAPLARNIPVILALLRVWNRNFLGFPAHGVVPYDQRLGRFPAWLQQLEMESNGKQVGRDGTLLAEPASPLIWGEAGTNAQHSFFQFLHQGVDVVPIDILVPLAPVLTHRNGQSWKENHTRLVNSAVAQSESLAMGSSNPDEPHRNFPGNRPSTIISWPRSTPYHLGQLLALYENITISCGFLWGVNSFDQWGVELGKKIALAIESPDSGSRLSDAALNLLKSSRELNQ